MRPLSRWNNVSLHHWNSEENRCRRFCLNIWSVPLDSFAIELSGLIKSRSAKLDYGAQSECVRKFQKYAGRGELYTGVPLWILTNYTVNSRCSVFWLLVLGDCWFSWIEIQKRPKLCWIEPDDNHKFELYHVVQVVL